MNISSALHPPTNSATEVMNMVVENYIRFICEYEQKTRHKLLPAVEFAYSSAISEDLGPTAFEVDPEWRPRGPLSLTSHTELLQDAEYFKLNIKGSFVDVRYAHTLKKSPTMRRSRTTIKTAFKQEW